MLLNPSHRPPLLNASERARAARLRGAARLRARVCARKVADVCRRNRGQGRKMKGGASSLQRAMRWCAVVRGGRGGARYVSGSLKKLFKSSSEKSFELST